MDTYLHCPECDMAAPVEHDPVEGRICRICGTRLKVYPAQIAFIQADQHVWAADLVASRNKVYDRQRGHHLVRHFYCVISEHSETGCCDLATGVGGGRRYRTFPNLDAAQTAAVVWAKRRYYVF